MGTLDLKKLSKGMNIVDKLNLLFQDINRQSETDGKEFILTPVERDAIIADARKNNQMSIIRKTHELYQAAMFTAMDLETTNLSFLLAATQVEKTLIGIMLKGGMEEIVGGVIYDLAKHFTLNDEELDKKCEELRSKYKVDDVLFKGYDFFIFPPISGNNLLKDEDSQSSVPNEDIQKNFMMVYRHAQKLKRKLFEMEYILSLSSIDFLPAYNKRLIKESEELITSFVDLDSLFRSLRLYRDYGSTFVKNAELVEAEFLSIIQDIKGHLELTDEEKDKIKARIDKSIQEGL